MASIGAVRAFFQPSPDQYFANEKSSRLPGLLHQILDVLAGAGREGVRLAEMAVTSARFLRPPVAERWLTGIETHLDKA